MNVEHHRDEIVDFTRALVAIPTENPPGNGYPEAVQLICRHLNDLGFEDTRVEGDCVLSFVGTGQRTLYFSGHYDVVPAQYASQFEPAIKGANLFGRGSSDMKGGLAAMVYAAKMLCDNGSLSSGRIGLVFVPDEETAGPRGSRFLSDRRLLGRDAIGMLTAEPTSGVIWHASRGAITLKVTVKGKAAHVGRQFEGVNAFECMLRVVEALSILKEKAEGHTTNYRIAPDAARRSILLIGGRAEAGTNFNVVPDSCWFTIDRRINPEENFEEEKRRLLAVLDEARAASTKLDFEVIQEGRAAASPDDSPVATALARSVEQATGDAPKFEMCPGLLETRFYAERGIPAYAYGPGLLTVAHGPNEFVPIDRILQCATVYALTAEKLLA